MEDFNKIFQNMQLHGMQVPEERVQINIPNAKEITKQGLEYFINREGKQPLWIDEYDQIAEWLADNKGLGLLLHGKCGVGKTIMARYVIPGILLSKYQKVVSCYDINELNSRTDEILRKKIISIDDVGTEEISVKYGEKRMAFAELMDIAEKQSKLIIITTNLTADQILSKYGNRTMDRIKAITKRIPFNGESFRNN
jgi:DNA replication protein DnaC